MLKRSRLEGWKHDSYYWVHIDLSVTLFAAPQLLKIWEVSCNWKMPQFGGAEIINECSFICITNIVSRSPYHPTHVTRWWNDTGSKMVMCSDAFLHKLCISNIGQSVIWETQIGEIRDQSTKEQMDFRHSWPNSKMFAIWSCSLLGNSSAQKLSKESSFILHCMHLVCNI